MALQKEAVKTPSGIGEVHVYLCDFGVASGKVTTASYDVEVLFSDGSIVHRQGNLVPELTGPQATQAQAFMTAMRALAVAGFLP